MRMFSNRFGAGSASVAVAMVLVSSGSALAWTNKCCNKDTGECYNLTEGAECRGDYPWFDHACETPKPCCLDCPGPNCECEQLDPDCCLAIGGMPAPFCSLCSGMRPGENNTELTCPADDPAEPASDQTAAEAEDAQSASTHIPAWALLLGGLVIAGAVPMLVSRRMSHKKR